MLRSQVFLAIEMGEIGYVLRATCYVLRATCYVLRATCYVKDFQIDAKGYARGRYFPSCY